MLWFPIAYYDLKLEKYPNNNEVIASSWSFANKDVWNSFENVQAYA